MIVLYEIYIKSWDHPLSEFLYKLWIIGRIILFQEGSDGGLVDKNVEVLFLKTPEDAVFGSYFIERFFIEEIHYIFYLWELEPLIIIMFLERELESPMMLARYAITIFRNNFLSNSPLDNRSSFFLFFDIGCISFKSCIIYESLLSSNFEWYTLDYTS